MTPGYSLEDIAALKAVPPGDRAHGISFQVGKDIKGNPAWYTWSATDTRGSEDDLIVIPDDEPNVGSWLKTNRNYLDLYPQASITSGPVGTYQKGRAETVQFSGLLGMESAISINLPDNCIQFISSWALTFQDPNQAYDVRWDLSGHYSSPTFTHYLDSWLTYNYWGFYPEMFGIAWFRDVRFGDNLNLESAEGGKLNCSIYQSQETRELHLYNKTGFPVYLTSTLTCGFASLPLEDEGTAPE